MERSCSAQIKFPANFLSAGRSGRLLGTRLSTDTDSGGRADGAGNSHRDHALLRGLEPVDTPCHPDVSGELAATLNSALQGAAVFLMSPFASETIGHWLHTP